MNRLRLILIAAALIAALLAAYLSAGLLRPSQQANQPQVVVQRTDLVDVLVAAKALFQGEQLGNFAVQWQPWPRDAVTEQMITKVAMPDAIDRMQQARARLPMVAGEPIVDSKIVRPADRGFMSAIVQDGMRAVAVPISEATAVSGFILPNDRVDVIISRQIDGPNNTKIMVTDTVLTNVKVLAINQSLRAGDDGVTVPNGRNAVLELDPVQAEVLAKVTASGTLTLALRSLAQSRSGDRPEISEAYRNPRKSPSGPLIVRFGLEQANSNR